MVKAYYFARNPQQNERAASSEHKQGRQAGSMDVPGNTKGGSITVLLTSCSTGLDWSVLQIKTKIVSCHTADSKTVKQEVNDTVILPPLVFPGCAHFNF